MEQAVEMYQQQQDTLEELEEEEKFTLKEICKYWEERCLQEDREVITLNRTTLTRRYNGIPSQAKSNAACSWVTEAEAQVLIAYAVQLGNKGWAFSQWRLEEHTKKIIEGQHDDTFEGVGQNWTDHFILKHKKQLKPCWSWPLDNQRAQAGNAEYKTEYYSKLHAAIEGEEGEEPILEELMYGVDKTGIQQGIGQKEWVYGDPTKSFQHQQHNGGRENITIIATICANGTSTLPAVIYKAETYHLSWKQDNPFMSPPLGESFFSLGFQAEIWCHIKIERKTFLLWRHNLKLSSVQFSPVAHLTKVNAFVFSPRNVHTM